MLQLCLTQDAVATHMRRRVSPFLTGGGMRAALFLWPYRPYLSFADVDEFLLIQKPGQNVTDLIADPACFDGAHQVGVPHHQVLLSSCMQ